MAAPSGQLKAWKYFTALALILVVIYGLIFLTGNKKPHPKLGLDLQGGTSMTLTASQANGRAPSADSLERAREIIADRVDATGVSEPDVVTEGDKNIVVNVAGATSIDELRQLVQPAVLRFRKVLQSANDTSAAADTSSPSASPSASGSPAPNPSASGSASAAANPSASASAAPSGSASAAPSASETPAPVSVDVEKKRAEVAAKLGTLYEEAKNLPDPGSEQAGQLTKEQLAMLEPFAKLSPEEVAVLPADLQYKVPVISCKQLSKRPVEYVQDPKQKIVACDKATGSAMKYFLDVAKVLGEDVSDASFGNDPTQGWKVNLSFTSGGQDRWTALTKEAYNNGAKEAVAIVLDNEVVSAPSIQSVISGDAEITGKFTKKEASTLRSQLKYGSLPLSFKIESVDDVTPTLGMQAMKGGLLAGAIGLALVIIYCMLYYRALGLVVIASLCVSGSIVFGALVLLGRHLSFSLTLAGIAGFIVAIGITADSFIVFFERLKDEVKDGKTVRSAVPKAWVRARRTIISADMVSILAAGALYFLAVGPVKGFAFTLGMSTIIDLLIVFLFTHPLVAVLSRASTFTSPRFSGLGNVRSDSAVAQSAQRLGVVRTKES